MNARDLRQVVQMRGRIEDYEKRKVPLSVLIGDLEFLLDAVEEIDEQWKDKVRFEWGALEECYAVMLSEGRDSLNPNEERIVLEALNQLKKLLSDSLIRRYA